MQFLIKIPVELVATPTVASSIFHLEWNNFIKFSISINHIFATSIIRDSLKFMELNEFY